MAKIIERGDAHVQKPVRYPCKRCRSIIEFSREDIKSDQRDADYVVCPVCGAFISARVLWDGEMT